MTLRGIDVSSAQGTIDWAQVAASGIQAAFTKATEGTNYVNPTLGPNLAGMRAAGVLRAVYHFALPARNSPADEAAHFIQAFKPYSQAFDVIALDMEPDPYGGSIPADCSAWALQWLTIVEAEFGTHPLLYTNRDLIANHGLAVVAANGNGLWLSDPGDPHPDPAPWTVLAIQQTSWAGSVPGITGAVDLDQFNGTADQFKRYGIPADVPKDPRDLQIAALTQQVADLTTARDQAYARITRGLALLPGLQAALQGVAG